MNKKILIYITIIIIITIIIVILFKQKKSEKNLVSPGMQSVQTTEPILKFDASTDLEKELESVDPKVLDSDFNE